MTARAAERHVVIGDVVGDVARTAAAPGLVGRVYAQLRRSVAVSVGGVVLVAVVFVALLAPVLATHDPIANSLVERI